MKFTALTNKLMQEKTGLIFHKSNLFPCIISFLTQKIATCHFRVLGVEADFTPSHLL